MVFIQFCIPGLTQLLSSNGQLTNQSKRMDMGQEGGWVDGWWYGGSQGDAGSVMRPPRKGSALWWGHWASANVESPSFTGCPCSASHCSWGPTHICGLHEMVKQVQVLQRKDLTRFFHQGLEQYCGQPNESGEKRNMYEIQSQGTGCLLSQA